MSATAVDTTAIYAQLLTWLRESYEELDPSRSDDTSNFVATESINTYRVKYANDVDMLDILEGARDDVRNEIRDDIEALRADGEEVDDWTDAI